jgi:hypothetical protein
MYKRRVTSAAYFLYLCARKKIGAAAFLPRKKITAPIAK